MAKKRGRPKVDDFTWCRRDGRYITPRDRILWAAAVCAFVCREEGLSLTDPFPRNAGGNAVDDIVVCLRENRNGRILPTREQRRAMKAALRQFGPDALWTPLRLRELGLDDLPTHPDHILDDMRSLLRAHIRELWWQGQTADEGTRRDARTILLEVLRSLVPEARGRGKSQRVKPVELVRKYYDYRLRWSLVRLARLQLCSQRRRPATLKDAGELSRMYELPFDEVRAHMGLEEDGRFQRFWDITPHSLAIKSLAEEVGKTAATLKKELSRIRKNSE